MMRAAPRRDPATEPRPRPTTGTLARLSVIRKVSTRLADLARQICASLGLDRLHRTAAARPLDDAYDRQTKLRRHVFRHHRLLTDGCIGGAATHREIIADDNNRTTIDFRTAKDAIGRREVGQLAVRVVVRHPRDGADLVKACWRRSERSTRSRTVRRPPSCWRLTRSAPPMRAASVLRFSSSASSAAQLILRRSSRASRVA